METKTQHGYLILADISGFTTYLAGVELEHAHEILTELLELIVERFRPALTIAKLEGDAVFAYAPESSMPRGETLLELIEACHTRDVRILSLEVLEPNLESVFLHLTGKRLRD